MLAHKRRRGATTGKLRSSVTCREYWYLQGAHLRFMPSPPFRTSGTLRRQTEVCPFLAFDLQVPAAGRASTTQSAYHLLGTVQRSNPGEQRTDVTPSASRIKHEHQPQTKVSSPPIAPQSLGPAWESQSRRTHQYCLGIRRLPQRAWMSSNVTACSDYLHLPR